MEYFFSNLLPQGKAWGQNQVSLSMKWAKWWETPVQSEKMPFFRPHPETSSVPLRISTPFPGLCSEQRRVMVRGQNSCPGRSHVPRKGQSLQLFSSLLGQCLLMKSKNLNTEDLR